LDDGIELADNSDKDNQPPQEPPVAPAAQAGQQIQQDEDIIAPAGPSYGSSSSAPTTVATSPTTTVAPPSSPVTPPTSPDEGASVATAPEHQAEEEHAGPSTSRFKDTMHSLFTAFAATNGDTSAAGWATAL